MNNKKGVEITLNTMIIAIICLIVLAVVLIIFSDVLGDQTSGLSGIGSCEARGEGAGCIGQDEDCDGTRLPRVGGCKDETPICCIPKN